MKAKEFYWASNIKYLRNRKGLSQDELAAELGISRSKLNAHENGQSKNPPVEDLLNFSAYFSMNIDTLLKIDLGKLSELKLKELEAGNDGYITGSTIRVLATAVDAGNHDHIEYVPLKARAGYLAGYSDPEYIGGLPVFSMPHLPRDKKFRMFPTTGDSMFPIPENSLVIGSYLEDWGNIKDQTPCIVIMREEGIVFKLVTNLIKGNRSLLLESLNSAYAPYEVPAGAILEVWKFVNYISDTIPAADIPLQELTRVVQEMRTDLRKLAARQ